MIKVGQFMSSRLDVLPPEITKELEGLQDEVPPVAFAAIRALAEAELGMPLERAFASIDPTPLAAASLGQAHRVRLSAVDAADTGLDEVVVKIQRPGIDAIVDVDLAALRRVASLAQPGEVRRRPRRPALARRGVRAREPARRSTTSTRRATRSGSPRTSPTTRGSMRPQVVWERTTRRVLTLADVTAIKINDLDALRAAGIDPAAVAAEFAAVMFDQLFSDGFFHADPHPGNIFVTPVERRIRMPPPAAPGP